MQEFTSGEERDVVTVVETREDLGPGGADHPEHLCQEKQWTKQKKNHDQDHQQGEVNTALASDISLS